MNNNNNIKNENINISKIRDFLKKRGEKIKNMQLSYIPISIERNTYVYSDNNPTHVLIIGTSRSGKTQQWILPQIEIFAANKVHLNKRTMVISDPKGEIAQNTAQICRNNGYDVKFLNVKIPPKGEEIEGLCFNPMEIIMDLYLQELQPYIQLFDWDTIQSLSNTNNDKYFFFVTHFEKLKEEYKNIHPLNLVEMEVYLSVINSGIISIEGKDPYFEQTAQNYFTMFSLMLLDKSIANADVRKNERGEWEFANYNFKKYYSIPNIVVLFNEMVKLDDNKKTVISKQIVNKKVYGDIYGTGSLRIPQTSKLASFSYNESCCSTFTTKLRAFEYETIRRITSTNDINLFEIAKGEKPTIIYLIAPDYDSTFNSFITLFVSLFYFVLIKETEKSESGKLNRKVSFILDEFGNIPTINQFAATLTASLGRGISYAMVVQNIGQIREKYGEEVASTILDNTHMKIYFSAAEEETREWFSKQLGSTTVLEKTHSNSSNDLGKRSVMWAEREKRLVTSDELGKNVIGVGYISILNCNPVKGNFVPFYTYNKEEPQLLGEFMRKNNIIPSHQSLNLQDLIIPVDKKASNKDSYYILPYEKNL